MKKILFFLLLGITTLLNAQETFTYDDAHSVDEDTAFHCFPLDVDGVGVIDDNHGLTKVCLYLNSNDDGDLIIILISPDGTQVVLSSYNGGDGDDYGYAPSMMGGGNGPTCLTIYIT